MTTVAAGPKIVEIQSQIRPLLNRYLMVSVQVPCTGFVPVAKLVENTRGRWVAKIEFAEVRD